MTRTSHGLPVSKVSFSALILFLLARMILHKRFKNQTLFWTVGPHLLAWRSGEGDGRL